MKKYNFPKVPMKQCNNMKLSKVEMYSLLDKKRLEKMVDGFKIKLVLDRNTKSIDIIYTKDVEVTVNGYDPHILVDLQNIFIAWFKRELEVQKSLLYYLNMMEHSLQEIEKLLNKKVLDYEKSNGVNIKKIMKGCLCIEPYFSKLPETLKEQVNYVKKMRKNNQELI